MIRNYRNVLALAVFLTASIVAGIFPATTQSAPAFVEINVPQGKVGLYVDESREGQRACKLLVATFASAKVTDYTCVIVADQGTRGHVTVAPPVYSEKLPSRPALVSHPGSLEALNQLGYVASLSRAKVAGRTMFVVVGPDGRGGVKVLSEYQYQPGAGPNDGLPGRTLGN